MKKYILLTILSLLSCTAMFAQVNKVAEYEMSYFSGQKTYSIYKDTLNYGFLDNPIIITTVETHSDKSVYMVLPPLRFFTVKKLIQIRDSFSTWVNTIDTTKSITHMCSVGIPNMSFTWYDENDYNDYNSSSIDLYPTFIYNKNKGYCLITFYEDIYGKSVFDTYEKAYINMTFNGIDEYSSFIDIIKKL